MRNWNRAAVLLAALVAAPADAVVTSARVNTRAVNPGASRPGAVVAPSLNAGLTYGPVVAPVNLKVENLRVSPAPQAMTAAAPPVAAAPLDAMSEPPRLSPLPQLAPDAPDAPADSPAPRAPAGADAPTPGSVWRAKADLLAVRMEEMRRHFEVRAPGSTPAPRSGRRSGQRAPRALSSAEKARFGFPREEEVIGALSDGDLEVLALRDGRFERRRLEGRFVLRVTEDASGSDAARRDVTLDGGATWQNIPVDAKTAVRKLKNPPTHHFGRVRGRAPRPVMTQARQMWGAIEDFWRAFYPDIARMDKAVSLILYQGYVHSPAGLLLSNVGPVYLPAHRRAYMPQEFYDDLVNRFAGDGGFARLYVLAHEYGHHVQNHIGLHQRVEKLKRNAAPVDARILSLMVELHADALAGYFAAHAQHAGIAEPGDLEVATDVITQIGDDTLRRNSGSPVKPETFTHGSSAQRRAWFQRGLAARSPAELDPFSDPELVRGLTPYARARMAEIRELVAKMPPGA